MAYLIVQRIDGSTETLELSRSQPLSIGRESFNDICVPEDDVHAFHCRIGWNKKHFEITAATSQGVEVNSTTVAHVELKQGDLVRIGTIDLVFEETVIPLDDDDPPSPSRKSRIKVDPSKKPVEELSVFEGKIVTQSDAMIENLFDEDEVDSSLPMMSRGKIASKEKASPKENPKEKKRIAEIGGLGQRQIRPGEQEVLKSPLVLGLSAAGLLLLLVTGIFWFLLSREQSNRLYDRAVAEMNGGQYVQSIASFEKFIQQYPNHAFRRQAARGLAKALVRKDISGATPAWKRGLEQLKELINAHRNESDFAEMQSTLFQLAEQISFGAAKTAETSRDPELLVISKEAQTLLERYADPSAPPTGSIGRINEQRVKADRAIEKQKTFDLAMKTADDAIANRKPMEALSERERLLKRFPEYVNSKRVREALQKSLDLERSVVAVDDAEVPAQTNDETPLPNEPILGLVHARSRTDEASQGNLVFILAKDSCYAVDSVTGELVWRRVIGFDSPFFPVTTTGAQSSVLLFDSRSQSIFACELATGKLIWRQPLNSRAIGTPLVHEGQIYQSLDGSMLARIDVDTGRLSAKVRFSQNLATSPVLSRDGNCLFVPGEMAMIYSLSIHSTSTQQSLAAVATTFTDHAAGSISAPPLSMGRLLLLCENDRADSAKLRLWNAANPNESLIELASTNNVGQVRDTPVLRGNQLVVPSAGEQFAAFAVTDEAGHESIAPIGQYRADQARVREQLNTPIFLALGSDGQFWSAGSAFRRFEIVSDSIKMDSNSSAPGIASQPLQNFGEYFFVGRKSKYSDAVTFSAIEREKLINPWRCVVGDGPLEMLPTREDGLFWVGENGTLYSLSKARIGQSGVDLKAGADLDLPPNVTKPIRAAALHDQRMVVVAGGDTALLFLLNSSGQIAGKFPLTEFPEADPVLLDEGLILPLSGRLKLLPLSPGKKSVQDWIAPIGETQERHWSHLVRIDGRELIACEVSGLLTRIQFRQGDVPYLAEIAKLQLDKAVDVRPVLRGEFLYVADAGGTCRQLNVHSFDTDGQISLPEPIRQLWSAGSNTIVQAGDGKLHCLADGKTLPEKWSFDLKQLEPTGPIVMKSDAIWLACRNGTILILNPSSGEEIRRILLPQSLSLGLRQTKELMVAVAVDGTIYRVD